MKTVPTTHKIPAQLEDYFIDSTDLTSTQKTASRNELLRLLDQLGPEVNAYPIWHPILSSFSYLNPPREMPLFNCLANNVPTMD